STSLQWATSPAETLYHYPKNGFTDRRGSSPLSSIFIAITITNAVGLRVPDRVDLRAGGCCGTFSVPASFLRGCYSCPLFRRPDPFFGWQKKKIYVWNLQSLQDKIGGSRTFGLAKH